MKKFLMIPALAMSLNLFGTNNDTGNKEPKVGEIVWNELSTPNIQASKDFYGKVFGWEFVDVANVKNDQVGSNYTIIKQGDKDFAGMWEIPTAMQNQIPPHWIAYIYVENIEQSLDKACKNGAIIIKPAQKAGDKGSFAIIKDPAGAHIALWQPLKKMNDL